ncbi:MAG: hypothetical protein QF689_18235 [Candidatus Latescibacteria bacterium]|nr:hypothetical protein [Gemmatimonadaceae bacterium]MDP7450529.1 hypothetical protein [Candidatus Latescibacterota bacterium]HJP29115.1 hypothetical protein [Candidatus Latescibacterota bacterium]
MQTLEISGRTSPPEWAVRQRHLFDQMNRAAPRFVDKYTREDGTFIWRDEWPGMDGSDDGYEAYLSFPLFYVLGGSEEIHGMSRSLWTAVTEQFTRFGTVTREFDRYYDWMHHGEAYTYLHYFGLADPDNHVDRQRALKFAAMYNGEDPEAPNWDAGHKLIRSPINGAAGPCFEMQWDDWVTHRANLSPYLAPYEDIPGHESDDPFVKLDWSDDEVYARILKTMNERMVPGDVPLNLNATSLIANAFLYTGEEKYRQWVLDYIQAWMDRTEANGGLLPDNVGPTGKIGERMNGNWWGGYYGWRWPHGGRVMLEALCNAGCNATMLTGDPSWLDLFRSQADKLWEMRREEDGKIMIPNKYGQQGWFEYIPHASSQTLRLLMHAFAVGRQQQDMDRIDEQYGDRPLPADGPLPGCGKAGSFSIHEWFEYTVGRNPDFPSRVLEITQREMGKRLDTIDSESLDWTTWNDGPEWQDVHHWQNINPVVPEGMMQMAMGTPTAVYHGGMIHASIRYFDGEAKRPGLPPHVAALVDEVGTDHIHVQLVNTDIVEGKQVVLQAGGCSEHHFSDVIVEADGAAPITVDGQHVKVSLGPGAHGKLRLGLKRLAHTPSYSQPEL